MLMLAADTVAEISGVKSVDNQPVLKGDYPTQSSAAWIHRKVNAMFYQYHDLDDEHTEAGMIGQTKGKEENPHI